MTAFWMAWIMFWIVPSPVTKWDKRKMKGMLMCMPVIGLFIGGIWAGAAWLASRYLQGKLLASALLTLIPWILTGFLHLDGYMDCADAVLSFRDREERLRILKDSHVGSFAVVMLAVLFLVSFGAVADTDMSEKWLTLLFVPAVTRACCINSVLSFKPLEHSSYWKMHQEGVGKGYKWASGLLALLLTGASFLVCGKYGFAVLYGAVSTYLTVFKVKKNLGGMSGDISGCALTIGEACALAALSLL